jgi:energy-coupling factor transporter ATP-binding protein EcfA2
MSTRTISLRNLTSFGDVAAEDDPVLDYFLTTAAVAQIDSGTAYLILGRKGSGKTALVRYYTESPTARHSRAMSLKGYPWSVHAQRIDHGASDIEAYVSSWRYIIATQFASLLLTDIDDRTSVYAQSLSTFLTDNYGSINPTIDAILRPAALKLSRLSFEPQVLGNKLGGIALERNASDMRLGLELNALTDAILQAVIQLAAASHVPRLTIHFDELDQGLSSLDVARQSMLVGLVLAVRSVQQESRKSGLPVSPLVYLRTDLWDELAFSDKNKITSTSAINLEWTSSTLLELVNARLRKKLAPHASWDSVAESSLMRGSQTKWEHMVSRTFLRPRDIIRFLNAALEQAKKRQDEPLVFQNPDIVSARDVYSPYLKSELDDEIPAHWGDWEDALRACSAISTITFTHDEFVAEYAKSRVAANAVDADDALRTLFAFSVIGYEGRSGYGGSKWVFKYIDKDSRWDASATRYKVHIGLKEYAKLREERS